MKTAQMRKWSWSVAALLLILSMMTPVASAAPQATGQPARLSDTTVDSKGNQVTPLTAQTFADPPQNDMPWVRWNWPPATATTAELETELQDMYDHNIAGVEIGQGGTPYVSQLKAIYKKANALGIKVSLKVAKGLPGDGTTLTYADTDAYARRTLAVYKSSAISAGGQYSTTLPGPTSGNAGTIVAVLAYRCTASGCTASSNIVDLDQSSVVDLTSTVTGTNTSGYQGGSTAGKITWTAPTSPAAASWLVLTIRAVPFGGSQPEPLSLAGTKELTDAYDTFFAGELGDLVKANGGDFFVDSHSADPWGAAEELWSSGMKSEFKTRAGYDITPYLPALFDSTMLTSSTGGYFSFSNGSGSRIRSDFNRVRSTMFSAYRLAAFQEWSHTYNMKLRVQMEDGPATSIPDQLETSKVLDRPEYESLTGSDQTDLYRPMASANHMTGSTWFSTECCANLNESYVATVQDAIIRMSHEFAGGVDRVVYHIYTYLYTNSSTWPGMGFSDSSKVGFSNAWNRTEPYWVDMAGVNDYFARNRQVLTQGGAKVDVAVYQRNYSSPAAFQTSDPSNRHWQDLGLQQAGYTWDYLDETLFGLSNAVVTNNRLAENGPAYKALIFDQYLYPSATNSARGGLSITAAYKILSYAKAGLPIIFVGTPTGTASLAESDTTLQTVVSAILSQPNSYTVASEADVPAMLASLGIEPAAKPAASANLLSVRRFDTATNTNYYFFYNEGVDAYKGNNSVFGYNPSNLYEEPGACRYSASTGVKPCMATGDALDTQVTLEGTGVPYTLDAFTGKITPIAQYSRSGSHVTVPVKLARDGTTIIALSDQANRFGVAATPTHVTSTNADSAVQTAYGTVAIRASKTGAYTATLSTGKTVTAIIGSVPGAMDLTNVAWHLNAEDWTPTNDYATSKGITGTVTTRTPVSLDLTALKPWPDIPALANASGIGTYTTTVELPSGWDVSYGAYLDLGTVVDTFALTVNGHAVAIDQVSARADVGPYLMAGTNTLVVRVATTYNNRLSALDAKVLARGVIQTYGLVGPVVLTPYRQAVVVPNAVWLPLIGQ